MGSYSTDYIKQLIQTRAALHGLNPAVILAQATCESALNPWAARHEPQWAHLLKVDHFALTNTISQATERIMQMTSWGLMQVMGAVARELGFAGPLPSLCNPETGLDLGCIKMKLLMSKHKELPKALAAYNAGISGTPAGEAYAKKVLALVKS